MWVGTPLNMTIPVFSPDVASMIGWYAATVDDDSKDYKSNASNNFHCAEDKLDLIG